jgi:hypothetical protein
VKEGRKKLKTARREGGGGDMVIPKITATCSSRSLFFYFIPPFGYLWCAYARVYHMLTHPHVRTLHYTCARVCNVCTPTISHCRRHRHPSDDTVAQATIKSISRASLEIRCLTAVVSTDEMPAFILFLEVLAASCLVLVLGVIVAFRAYCSGAVSAGSGRTPPAVKKHLD